MDKEMRLRIKKAAVLLCNFNSSAFSTEDAARKCLSETYKQLMDNKSTRSISTGGFIFIKDEDDLVDLWISVDIL